MSAGQLRRVGNLGVWVDPDEVVAASRHRDGVILLMSSGRSATVSRVDNYATDQAVAGVVAELQADVEDPPDAPDEP